MHCSGLQANFHRLHSGATVQAGHMRGLPLPSKAYRSRHGALAIFATRLPLGLASTSEADGFSDLGRRYGVLNLEQSCHKLHFAGSDPMQIAVARPPASKPGRLWQSPADGCSHLGRPPEFRESRSLQLSPPRIPMMPSRMSPHSAEESVGRYWPAAPTYN
jgi:hypothetical protein